MKRKYYYPLIACCILAIQVSGLCADNPEQLIAAHLESIGSADALSQIKSITLVGALVPEFNQGSIYANQGSTYTTSGVAMLVSEGTKIGIVISPGGNASQTWEHFAYDGKDVTTRDISYRTKTLMSDFIHNYDWIMKNGLLGGVYSRGWPFLDAKGDSSNMRELRKTKVDGDELYEFEYRPADRYVGMTINLYFDPETYRHVRTQYRSSLFILTEKFDDFRKVDGVSLTLPHNYTLEHSAAINSRIYVTTWNIDILAWEFNEPEINQDIFNGKKYTNQESGR